MKDLMDYYPEALLDRAREIVYLERGGIAEALGNWDKVGGGIEASRALKEAIIAAPHVRRWAREHDWAEAMTARIDESMVIPEPDPRLVVELAKGVIIR